MTIKKIALITGTSLATIALVSTMAFAQGNGSDNNGSNNEDRGKGGIEAQSFSFGATQTMSLSSNGNGTGKIRGNVVAVNGTTISVASWGGTWIVDASDVKVLERQSALSSVSQIAVGHNVEVSGTFSKTGWDLKANKIFDRSIQKMSLTGVISNLNTSAGTLTLTGTKNGDVNIVLNSDATITINGATAKITDLQNGQKAKVTGIADGVNNLVRASMLRESPTKQSTGSN